MTGGEPLDPRRRAARPRLAGAVAASLFLHALLLALLVRLVPPPLPRAAIPVELVPAPEPPRSPVAAAPSAQQRPPEPGPPRRGEARPLPLEAPAPAPVARAAPAPAPPGGANVERWFEERGLGSGARPRRPEPGRDPLAVAPPRVILDEARREGEEERDPAKRAKRRIDDMLAELKARDLARYPDASWMELRDGLADGFAPTPDLVRRGGADGAAGALGDAVKAYGSFADRYARTGTPFEHGADAPGEVARGKAAVAAASEAGDRDRESLRAGLDRLDAAGAAGSGGSPWSRGLVAVVELEQDAHGVVTGARIVGRSGNAAYDRLAMEQVRKLVGRSLAPRLAGTRTRWAIATDFMVTPPVPAVGMAFDANFKPTGLSYPFRRSTRTRVEILSVRQGDG